MIDNDHISADLHVRLERDFGAMHAKRYWSIFEEIRVQKGYADYIGALQQFRIETECVARNGSRLIALSSFLIDYPFVERLLPRALDVVAYLNTVGRAVILSDGEPIFQGRKIQRAGLWDAVSGRVLIYVHKEQMLDTVRRVYPAQHYVLVDDKLSILSAAKAKMRESLTTVFPLQGHYALDPQIAATYPPADITIERIADLLRVNVEALLGHTETACS
ncbi:MAG TPA: HAD family hydrolase [Casimicrobium sp.]|nr:HAD family hydrolase [Casimicrobium sp.]